MRRPRERDVRRMIVLIASGIIPAVAGAGGALAQPVAVGHTEAIVRSVYGTVETMRRPLAVRDDVFWQELIETGPESAAKMVFVDDSTLSAGPDSSVRIDEFVLPGGPPSGRIIVTIARGLLRFVTGRSPSDAYLVRTPSAVIGVRGTDFSVLVSERGETRVQVFRGQISLAPLFGTGITVREGRSSRVEAPTATAPEPPTPADPEVTTATTETAALLMIAGEGDRSLVVPESSVEALQDMKLQAASARAKLSATQLGPGCGGC